MWPRLEGHRIRVTSAVALSMGLSGLLGCASANPATANTACADYSPDNDPVTRHVAALEIADAIDASKPPGPHAFTDVRTIVDKITDVQMAAAASVAVTACRLHPHSSVLDAVVVAVGKGEFR